MRFKDLRVRTKGSLDLFGFSIFGCLGFCLVCVFVFAGIDDHRISWPRPEEILEKIKSGGSWRISLA
jgi:hypothetical protein